MRMNINHHPTTCRPQERRQSGFLSCPAEYANSAKFGRFPLSGFVETHPVVLRSSLADRRRSRVNIQSDRRRRSWNRVLHHAHLGIPCRYSYRHYSNAPFPIPSYYSLRPESPIPRRCSVYRNLPSHGSSDPFL